MSSLVRLGCCLTSQSLLGKCDCGRSVDIDGDHLLTCKTGGGPVHTHNAITAVWSDCLRSLHLNHKRETQFRYSDSNNRPDITVFDQQSGTTLDLDIAVVHPWCPDVLGKAAKEDGAAAARREEIKTRKYQQEKLAVTGVVASCKPLVLEIFGRWRWSAQKYLCSLSALYQDEDGRNNPVEFKAIWRKRMSIMLQKNISITIINKIKSIGQSSACDTFSLNSGRIS